MLLLENITAIITETEVTKLRCNTARTDVRTVHRTRRLPLVVVEWHMGVEHLKGRFAATATFFCRYLLAPADGESDEGEGDCWL